VTRDYGAKRLATASVKNPPESETVLRLLDHEEKITTRYGGGFVQSINGISGTVSGGRSYDWFFYVNGIESPVGSADVKVHGGDRIWWDYRDWTDAMSVPAVVGSWPEPFANGSEGKRFPVTIDCLGADDDCQGVSDKLDAAGVPASIAFEHARVGSETLRVVVGPWDRVRDDTAAGEIESGPGESGVFAAFDPKPKGGYQLTALNARNRETKTLGAGTGLVAATKLENEQPTWVVTGTDEAGVQRAVDLLTASSLRDRYAVAVDDHGREVALPTP
jgi:Domain of unknown function (DUF4430)